MDRSPPALVRVIMTKPFAHLTGFNSNNGVFVRIVRWSTPKDRNRDRSFFEFALRSGQNLPHHIGKKVTASFAVAERLTA